MPRWLAVPSLGIVGLLCGVILTGGSDPPTSGDATAESVRQFFAEGPTSQHVGNLLVVALGFAVLVLAAAQSAVLAQAGQRFPAELVACAGTASALVFWLVAFIGALPVGIPLDDVDDATVTTLYTILIDGNEILLQIAGPALGAWVGAVAVGSWRARLGGRFLTGIGLASATLLVLGPVAILRPLTEANEGAWSAPWFLGFLLLLVWLVASSVRMLRGEYVPRSVSRGQP